MIYLDEAAIRRMASKRNSTPTGYTGRFCQSPALAGKEAPVSAPPDDHAARIFAGAIIAFIVGAALVLAMLGGLVQ